MPESSIVDQNGAVARLDAFKGRFVLVDVWATWCVPCRIELPMLESLQKLLGPEGLTVLPVSVDKKDITGVMTFYRQNNFRALPMLFDPDFRTAETLRVAVLPTAILVNRHGQEIGRVVSGRGWSSPEVIAFLRDLLKRP
ncbi:MAG: TlpA family protein disulfide reductase [Proteobacteria bacterium]|nr:TlpA family protein disulfide reductase [Pseudomonadota bacterium]